MISHFNRSTFSQSMTIEEFEKYITNEDSTNFKDGSNPYFNLLILVVQPNNYLRDYH
jgi:hypothetical protein